MSTAISATTFQRDIGKYLHEVQTHNATYIVTQHGRDAIVLLHPDEYARLVEESMRLKWLNGMVDTGSTEPSS